MSGEAGVSKRVRGKPFLCSAELEREKAQVRWAAWGALSRGGRKEGKKVDERTATCKRSSTGVSVMALVGMAVGGKWKCPTSSGADGNASLRGKAATPK